MVSQQDKPRCEGCGRTLKPDEGKVCGWCERAMQAQLEEARQMVRQHRVCMDCGKLKHRDGRAHGPSFNPHELHSRGVSSGICLTCKALRLHQPIAGKQRREGEQTWTA